ncbi:MAG: alpha/beta fold hydrolase [Nodularia sp. CChRGM 3473]
MKHSLFEPVEQFIPIKGGNIYTVSYGNSEEWIVCLHGSLGATHEYLVPTLSQLYPHYRVLFYDQRGLGQSQGDFSLSSLADHLSDLCQIVDSLNIKKCHLIGHSWGALLTLLFAEINPTQVAQLILLNPSSPIAEHQFEVLENIDIKLRQQPYQAFLTKLEQTYPHQEWIDWYQEFAFATMAHFNDPQVWLDLPPFKVQQEREQILWQILATIPIKELLAKITMPVVTVYGEQDEHRNFLTTLKENLQDLTTFIVPDCGHFVMVEKPENFLEIMLNKLVKIQ